VRGILALLLVLAAVAGCVSPAWDERDYALKAQESAKSVSSTLQIVRVAVRDSGRLTRPYLKVVLTEAAEELGDVGRQFGGVQPPTQGSDRLRARLLDRIQKAENLVDDLLIQVRRDGIEHPQQAAAELEELA
jgi:hypothetical protein